MKIKQNSIFNNYSVKIYINCCYNFNLLIFLLPLKYQTKAKGLWVVKGNFITDIYCRMMKLADMPSCLGGGGHRIKKIASSYFS